MLKDFKKCELYTRHDRTYDVLKSLKCKSFLFLFSFFIYSCFTKQRLDRVFKKIKNERVIVIIEKSRVNKKIRRIFINKEQIVKKNVKKERAIIIKKKRVNVKSLKFVIR